MIIHQPEIEIKNNEIYHFARIETNRKIDYFPDRLWFIFPEDYREYITDRSDAFLVCLILMSMHLGEDLYVKGVVSPKLAQNFEFFQDAYTRMSPDLFKHVDIKYERLELLNIEQVKRGVACGFSGGIDSMFTLWFHLPFNEPIQSSKLTHGLFIDGFDLFLHQESHYQYLYQKYSALFKKLDIDLLTVRTNIYSFSQFRLSWPHAHDPVLVGIAMIFSRLLQRFYKPAGSEIKNGKIVRSSYYAIPFLSTETLEVILDSYHLTRFQKLSKISNWSVLQNNLRVCMNPKKTDDGSACYRCEKCLNTLVYLDLLGVQTNTQTFRLPLTLGLFLRFGLTSQGLKRFYYPELPRMLFKHKRYGYLVLYYILLFPSELVAFLRRKIVMMLSPDFKYKLSRVFYSSHLPPKRSL